MSRLTQFTCDGCNSQKTVSLAKERPDDWKDVRLSWSGFVGYPTSRDDGFADYDLCPSCAKSLLDSINPLRWPRAHGGKDA